MANTQPYIYQPNRESQYSLVGSPFEKGFDPKAYTRASWAQPPPPKPKQTGPLLNFNRHPDSYLILPYGQTNAKPLPAHTKQRVLLSRRLQLGGRLLQMLGALGMLVCVICIKNTTASQAYILRVPVSSTKRRKRIVSDSAKAAIDILSTAYAIYHLSRAAKSRPPTSSASYHFFAFLIDAGLIPFYVFTALLTKAMQPLPFDDQYRWKTFFDSEGTNKIFLSTWILSIALSGFHLVAAIISLYLVAMFRNIAALPPDMNPLEDNLTSRRSKKYKHKYKNSELSVSDISGPTLISSTRSLSPAKDMSEADNRPLSFLHTRTDSDTTYSPHNPATAEASRSSLVLPPIPSIYQQPGSVRNSRVDLNHGPDSSKDARSEFVTDYSHRFMSEPSREPTVRTSSSVYTSRTSTMDTTHTPPLPRKSSKRHSLHSDNWFIHEDGEDLPRSTLAQRDNVRPSPAVSIVEEESDGEIGDESTTMAPGHSRRDFSFETVSSIGHEYQSVRQHSIQPRLRPVAEGRTELSPSTPTQPLLSPEYAHRGQRRNQHDNDDDFMPAPLRMNPPTPPPAMILNQMSGRSAAITRKPLPLTPTSGNELHQSEPVKKTPNTATKSPATTPKKSVGTPTKVKYYGDLNAAMAGVRGFSPSPPKSTARSTGNTASTTTSSTERKDWAIQDGGRKGRVVSRTGADARTGDSGSEQEGLRGRNVSGKVAEEGRAGVGWRVWGRG